MELFLRLDINIFAALILLILLFNGKVSTGMSTKTNLIFSRLTALVLILTISEIISFAVDLRPGAMMPTLNYLSNLMLFLLAPFAISLWAEYVEHYLLRDVPDLKARRLIRAVPILVIFVFVLTQPGQRLPL
jgi:hypothetical protein